MKPEHAPDDPLGLVDLIHFLQRTWIYPRPGELKSCVGCHENPHTTTRGNDPQATHYPPLQFLPDAIELLRDGDAVFTQE